ncbi:MAG: alanine racemase [Gemmatimonadetes bacterium]|nr:alanine racemase [Gemmatimonadota bacterium]
MSDRRTRAWIEVDAAALRRNLGRVRDAVGEGVGVIPMVKADAYGLGIDRMVGLMEPESPRAYGVATVEEGRRLRELGVEREVLVVAPVPPGSYQDAVESGLTLCISHLEGLRRLEEAVRRTSIAADFHVEVDTGMGRAGFDWRDAATWGPVVGAAHGDRIRWTGCFTHLYSADGADPAPTRLQERRLRDTLRAVPAPTEDFLVHVLNSAGALRVPELGAGAVRPGIFLYGGVAGEGLPAPDPVVTLRARVVHVREAPPGSTVGYGATHAARGWERWATLGIGYGDGLPRALGNRGHALLKGRRCPMVGRVSMDVTVVNLSNVGGVELGDVATLVGEDGGDRITLEEVAGLAGTINYEILTGLSRRLPRVWMDDGAA